MGTPMDATTMAALVREGNASPRELVDDAIARIDTLNPAINAVLHERFDKARAEADSANLADGPFRGVPMLVKDLGCAIGGEPHHQGNQALKDAGYVAPHDSYLYRRFCELGLITLGRTNTPEFGSTVTTEPLAYGACRNPWNLDHSTGGSSGGSAAAVAAGLVPIAHANDGGGSIRVPASECGLVGLKPSRGRVSQGPDIGEAWGGATIDGVVTRSVRDSATCLDGISGPEPGDPYCAPPPARPFAAEVGADPGQLKIGIAPPVAGVHEECKAAVDASATLLESLGHRVEVSSPAALEEERLLEEFVAVLAASTAADFNTLAQAVGRSVTAEDVEPDNWTFAEMGRAVSAADYLASLQWLHSWQRRLASWWADDGFDILVTPVIATPPPKIGYLSDPELGGSRVREVLLFTAQFNVSGQPAVSLPLHQSADGLPVGVQFVGPSNDEAMLIRLAAQLEQAAPWESLTPPNWAG